jgi:hypothetical protein
MGRLALSTGWARSGRRFLGANAVADWGRESRLFSGAEKVGFSQEILIFRHAEHAENILTQSTGTRRRKEKEEKKLAFEKVGRTAGQQIPG